MPTWLLIIIILVAIVAAASIALYIFGKRAEKKTAKFEADVERTLQPMDFYIIDMKKMRLKDAGLPKVVYEQANFMTKIRKMPILKVKIQNRVMNLMCDAEVYKTLAPKQEVHAMVSGLYVKSARRIRGPVTETVKKGKNGKPKQSFIDKLR